MKRLSKPVSSDLKAPCNDLARGFFHAAQRFVLPKCLDLLPNPVRRYNLSCLWDSSGKNGIISVLVKRMVVAMISRKATMAFVVSVVLRRAAWNFPCARIGITG